MTEIVRPEPLLLDSGHLINMAHYLSGRGMRQGVPFEWGEAYAALEGRMRSGGFIVLYHEPLAYEWIRNNSSERAAEVASILDRSLCVKPILPDPILFVVEAMNAARAAEPGLDYPGFDILRPLGYDKELAEWLNVAWPGRAENPELVEVAVPSPGSQPTATALVRGLAPHVAGGDAAFAEALAGQKHALDVTRDTQRRLGRKGPPTDEIRRHWLRTALRLEDVLRRTEPRFDAREIVEAIDLERCPAIRFKIDSFWLYARANENPPDNDMIDLTLLASIPYAAYSLIEKRLTEYVRQARSDWIGTSVFRSPVDLESALSESGP